MHVEEHIHIFYPNSVYGLWKEKDGLLTPSILYIIGKMVFTVQVSTESLVLDSESGVQF